MNDTPPLPTERLGNTLEELRASVAAEGPQKGLAGKIQRAILRLLEGLMALLAAMKDGALAAAVSEAPAAARALPRALGSESAARGAARQEPAGADPGPARARRGAAHEARPALAASPEDRCGDGGADRDESAGGRLAAAAGAAREGASQAAPPLPPGRYCPQGSFGAGPFKGRSGLSPIFSCSRLSGIVPAGLSFLRRIQKRGRLEGGFGTSILFRYRNDIRAEDLRRSGFPLARE